jgi:hypothetical protein
MVSPIRFGIPFSPHSMHSFQRLYCRGVLPALILLLGNQGAEALGLSALLAFGESYSTYKGAELVVPSIAGLLDDDTDADGDRLSAVSTRHRAMAS